MEKLPCYPKCTQVEKHDLNGKGSVKQTMFKIIKMSIF